MKKTNESGFTLMEMIITLTLIAILAGITAPYMGNGAQAYNHTATSLQTIDKLRYASERLARELREIQRDENGDYDIETPVSISGKHIIFTKTDGETVSIDDTAPTLVMAYSSLNANAPYVLTDELSSITFNYYLNDGIRSASTTRDISYIEFELILNKGNEYRQRTRVALRNKP